MRWPIILCSLSLHVMGCSTAPNSSVAPALEADPHLLTVVRALQAIHGPPASESWGPIEEMLEGPIRHDFNGDGEPELLFLLRDRPRGMERLDTSSIDAMRPGQIVLGFILLTKANGAWWPVYYFFDQELARIQFREIFGPLFEDEIAKHQWTEGLIVDTDRHGQELSWFWHPAHANWPYSFWTTGLRHRNQDKENFVGLARDDGPGAVRVIYGGK